VERVTRLVPEQYQYVEEVKEFVPKVRLENVTEVRQVEKTIMKPIQGWVPKAN